MTNEEEREVYNIYINKICNDFKIIRKKDFANEIAEHAINRPKDILNDKFSMKEWTDKFFEIILKSSSLSGEEIKLLMANDLHESIEGEKDVNKL